MKRFLFVAISTAVFGQMLPACCQSSAPTASGDDAATFQLKAPINSSVPTEKTDKPGKDDYRYVSRFPKQTEEDLMDSDITEHPRVVNRLTGMVGTFAQMKVNDQKDIVLGHLHGVLVEVQNGTDRPLIFDGDLATATIDKTHIAAAPLAMVDNAACPPKSGPERFAKGFVQAAAAAATIGGSIAVPDAQVQAGPILERYGADQARRMNEQSRFGKRVLWPGDTTSGVLYFKSGGSLKGFTIELPVTSTLDATDHSSISTVR